MSADAQEPRRVLYVDDEPSNLIVFEAAFEERYALMTANSAAEALVLMRQHPFDVLLTDMRMPDIDGAELLRRVLPEWPDVLRIVLTGYTDVETVVKAVNEGQVYQFVTKPWDIDAMGVMLDRAFQHADARRREKRLLATLDDQAHKEESIRTVFQRYAPEAVVRTVFEDDTWRERTAPERCEVTLLFADLRGFTPLCAEHPPERVLALLNAYFDLLTGIVEARGGTVNQFLGDAVLAFFGAPVAVPDPEVLAVGAALDMAEALPAFNRDVAVPLVGAPVRIGVGVQRGVAAVGSVGSPNKVVYTAVGDPIHQVGQVEAMCKGADDMVLVTAEVRERVAHRFELEPHGQVTFVGGSAPATLFRVLARKEAR
jgi:adenylate cyclase